LAQLDRTEEVHDLVRTFEVKHPNFDPQEFIEIYPITAAGAQRLFFEGVEKAGLN
jgi:hypothetical protein